MISHFIGLFIFSGCVVSFAHGMSICLSEPGEERSIVISLVFFLTAFLLLEHYCSSYYPAVSVCIGPVSSSVFALIKIMKYFIGPLLLRLYLMMFTLGKSRMKGLYFLHYIPGIVMVILVVITVPGLFFFSWNAAGIDLIYSIQENLGRIHLLSYSAYIIISILCYYNGFSDKLRRAINGILVNTLLTFAGMALLSVFIISNQKMFESAGLSVITLLIYLMIFNKRLSLNIISKASKEIKLIRYSRSLLAGIDTYIVSDRLNELMEDEKLYCDEDLTLQRLALHLEITPHQLSEFLNSHLGKNFNSYINYYRVREAKYLLKNQKDRSVLHIAYASGFNSKSVFYRVFTDSTGCTPLEYRNT